MTTIDCSDTVLARTTRRKQCLSTAGMNSSGKSSRICAHTTPTSANPLLSGSTVFHCRRDSFASPAMPSTSETTSLIGLRTMFGEARSQMAIGYDRVKYLQVTLHLMMYGKSDDAVVKNCTQKISLLPTADNDDDGHQMLS